MKRESERRILEKLTSGLVSFLVSKRVSPNLLTLSAFFSSIFSAAFYLYAPEEPLLYFAAASLFLFSGLLDAIDGAVARKMKEESLSGAFLDSILDKLSESIVIISITVSGVISPIWGVSGLASSILVSYVRARGESLGIKVKGIGLMERAERMILIIVATYFMILSKLSLEIAFIILTILSTATLIHRVFYVYFELTRRLS